jgi:hypothetical protein
MYVGIYRLFGFIDICGLGFRGNFHCDASIKGVACTMSSIMLFASDYHDYTNGGAVGAADEDKEE